MSKEISDPAGKVYLDRVQKDAIGRFWHMIINKKINLVNIDKCWCGSSQLERISNHDRFGLPFGTNLCKDCGLISQSLMIKEGDLQIFYK